MICASISLLTSNTPIIILAFSGFHWVPHHKVHMWERALLDTSFTSLLQPLDLDAASRWSTRGFSVALLTSSTIKPTNSCRNSFRSLIFCLSTAIWPCIAREYACLVFSPAQHNIFSGNNASLKLMPLPAYFDGTLEDSGIQIEGRNFTQEFRYKWITECCNMHIATHAVLDADVHFPGVQRSPVLIDELARGQLHLTNHDYNTCSSYYLLNSCCHSDYLQNRRCRRAMLTMPTMLPCILMLAG